MGENLNGRKMEKRDCGSYLHRIRRVRQGTYRRFEQVYAQCGAIRGALDARATNPVSSGKFQAPYRPRHVVPN